MNDVRLSTAGSSQDERGQRLLPVGERIERAVAGTSEMPTITPVS